LIAETTQMLFQVFQVLRADRRVSAVFSEQIFSFPEGIDWTIFDGFFVKTRENKIFAYMFD
jgi:hypothetical protein